MEQSFKLMHLMQLMQLSNRKSSIPLCVTCISLSTRFAFLFCFSHTILWSITYLYVDIFWFPLYLNEWTMWVLFVVVAVVIVTPLLYTHSTMHLQPTSIRSPHFLVCMILSGTQSNWMLFIRMRPVAEITKLMKRRERKKTNGKKKFIWIVKKNKNVIFVVTHIAIVKTVRQSLIYFASLTHEHLKNLLIVELSIFYSSCYLRATATAALQQNVNP